MTPAGKDDITPLHRAMWDRHYKMSQMLIKAGADVNCRQVQGTTPLMIASLWICRP